MGQNLGKDFRWKRPESSEYPKIWQTFKAKDINSDEMVEYQIKDLPESRYDEAIEMIVKYSCRDEPLCEAFGNKGLD